MSSVTTQLVRYLKVLFPTLHPIELHTRTYQPQHYTMTDLKAVIDQANRVFEGFFNSGDIASLAKLYTEDGALYPPNTQGVAFHGHEQIAAFWTSKQIQLIYLCKQIRSGETLINC
jgi:hypothetical protein